MAMIPQPDTLVCDRMGIHDGPVGSFTVTHGEDQWTIDLCITHRRPLLDIIEHGRRAEQRQRRRGFVKTDPMSLIRSLDDQDPLVLEGF